MYVKLDKISEAMIILSHKKNCSEVSKKVGCKRIVTNTKNIQDVELPNKNC